MSELGATKQKQDGGEERLHGGDLAIHLQYTPEGTSCCVKRKERRGGGDTARSSSDSSRQFEIKAEGEAIAGISQFARCDAVLV